MITEGTIKLPTCLYQDPSCTTSRMAGMRSWDVKTGTKLLILNFHSKALEVEVECTDGRTRKGYIPINDVEFVSPTQTKPEIKFGSTLLVINPTIIWKYPIDQGGSNQQSMYELWTGSEVIAIQNNDYGLAIVCCLPNKEYVVGYVKPEDFQIIGLGWKIPVKK